MIRESELEREALVLFERALGASEDALEAVLATATPGVRERSLVLLERLRSEEAHRLRLEDSPPEPDSRPGWVGPYRLIRRLGEGASGEVWEAEEERLERRIALKLLRGDWIRDHVRGALHRGLFATEARIQARLGHAGIAALYGAGVAEGVDGPQPYLAMEQVTGDGLLAHIESHQIDLDRRLALFEQLCAAIQHAHQRGVVHGDLKPANVLVTPSGAPKVLDFGVALILDEHGRGRARGGTRPYMAPEQAAGAGQDVDLRVDVHALGVILRESLAARPALRSAPDLESIVLRATAPDPDQRYPGVSELARDVARFRQRRPVEAHAGGAAYAIGRALSRHRIAAAATTSVLLTLVAALAFSLLQLGKARTEATKAWEVSSWVRELLRAASPLEGGRDLLALDLIEEAERNLAHDEQLDREVHAFLQAAVGNAYEGLGKFDRARPLLERSYRNLRRLRGEQDQQVLFVAENLALALREQGDVDQARDLLESCLAAHLERHGARDRRTLRSRGNLAQLALDEGDFALARELSSELLRLQRELFDPADLDLLVSLDNLAQANYRLGDYDTARTLWRECLALTEARHGVEHVHSILGRINLMTVLVEGDERAEAVALGRATLPIAERVLGPDHRDTHLARGNLAMALHRVGEYEEAVELQRAALIGLEERLGPAHETTIFAMQSLGIMLQDAGEAEEGRALLEVVYDYFLEEFGPGNEDVEFTAQRLGR